VGGPEQPAPLGRTVTDASVLTAAAILRSHGIRFIVIGGQAVGRTVSTGTSDVDVMVTTSDFDHTVALLLKDEQIRLRGLREGVALFAIESARGLGLDVLDSTPFAGDRPGGELYEFLEAQESSEAEGILYASTAFVWYTRLLTTRWRVYAEKILVNILDGANANEFRRVEEIAQKFGTQALVAERIAYVRRELSERTSGAPGGSSNRR
jgi:hypothetical protein